MLKALLYLLLLPIMIIIELVRKAGKKKPKK